MADSSRTASAWAAARAAERAGATRPRERQGREGHEREVVGHRRVQQEAVLPAVLGDERQAAGDRGARRRRQPPTRHEHLAAVERVEAEEGAQGLGAPGAHEAGEAEDLAAVEGEAESRTRPPDEAPGDLERHLAGGRAAAGREDGLDLPARP